MLGAIQIVYSHYMLTPSMECLWYFKFLKLCFKQEDQSIQWMTKGQAMAQRINILHYNWFVFRQQSPFLWEKPRSTSGSYSRQAGWLADEIWVDFKVFKILYKLNYLDSGFIDISTMLIIVLEVYFSCLFSNKAYFRVCFEVCEVQLPFFMSIPTIRY